MKIFFYMWLGLILALSTSAFCGHHSDSELYVRSKPAPLTVTNSASSYEEKEFSAFIKNFIRHEAWKKKSSAIRSIKKSHISRKSSADLNREARERGIRASKIPYMTVYDESPSGEKRSSESDEGDHCVHCSDDPSSEGEDFEEF